MRPRITAFWLIVGFLITSVARSAVIPVEPTDLTKRADLVGKEISVDDRVALFLLHPGRGIDEITLKRTPVVFRLPPRLRYPRSPGAPAVRLQGILKREGESLVCDVTAVELLPKDLERLNRGVEALPTTEFARRAAWAHWAEKRGHDFEDNELQERARVIEGEAIRIEADLPTADPAKRWLELAHRARNRNVPEPEASALAHKAFRRRLKEARSVGDLQSLTSGITGFFPEAKSVPTEKPDAALWERAYAEDPAGGYRAAAARARVIFDHRLWADATQALLEAQAAANPKEALTLADQAAKWLPDRPQLAGQFLEEGLKAATRGLGAFRLSEVETLAKIYRERLRQPDRAQALLREWLDEQREHRLSPTDAEGRVTLAGQYETLIGDKETAEELLRAAWRIDPQSKELTDAFRRRGFRKVNDEWVKASQASPSPDSSPADDRSAAQAARGQTLKGKTRKEVRNLLGTPNRIVFSATQGELIEQWIYLGPSNSQYVNFLHGSADLQPTVLAHYTLPRGTGGSPSP